MNPQGAKAGTGNAALQTCSEAQRYAWNELWRRLFSRKREGSKHARAEGIDEKTELQQRDWRRA